MGKFNFEDRPIIGIGWYSEPDYCWIRLGTNHITNITHCELYCGEYSIHWLEVWRDNKIIARYNSINIDCILYEEI